MTDRPPRSLDRLLDSTVDSVGGVELLLLVRAAGGRARAVEDLCATLASPRSWTLLQLERLARAGLVARDGDARWRYAPAGARLADAVEDLARAWQRDSRTVRRWVSGPPRRYRAGPGS